MSGATAPCTASPTNVIETLDETKLSGIGSTFTNKAQGGFVMDGREVTGSFVLEEKDTTGLSSFPNTVYGVGEITDDAWHSDEKMGAGEIGLGRDSTMMSNYELIHSSGFLIETGPVTDQSFVGGSAIDETKQALYIGGG